MIVRRRRRIRGHHPQASGHAQMHDQRAVAGAKQQVFGAALEPVDTPPCEYAREIARNRLTQRAVAHDDAVDGRARIRCGARPRRVVSTSGSSGMAIFAFGGGPREQPLRRVRRKRVVVRLIAAHEHELRLALQHGKRDIGAGLELDADRRQRLAVAGRLHAHRGRQPPFIDPAVDVIRAQVRCRRRQLPAPVLLREREVGEPEGDRRFVGGKQLAADELQDVFRQQGRRSAATPDRCRPA